MSLYLVTGGAGFIGSNIVQHLASEGEHVRVLDNFATGYRENLTPFQEQIELIEGDLLDEDTCRKASENVDYVLHQAAIPSVPRSLADPLLSHHVNVTGTLNLLIAARDAGVKRFVYAASSSAYGNLDAEYKHENLLPQPLSPYAASKLAGEHYVRSFCECFGMQAACLRYFNVFGPRQDPNSPYSAVVPLFIKAAIEGRKPVVYGDGRQSRDFTFVKNNVLANILAATADYDARGQVYNIACGHSYSLLDLLTSLEQILGKHIEAEFAPSRTGDVRDSKADIIRANQDLKYTVAVPFEEGLRLTVAYYQARLNKSVL
jgi:nucleoside-diphosphate-sugar epimerase